MHENIPQWGVWKENKIKELAKQNRFVLLICSPEMYRKLSEPGGSQIQMKAGHIDTLTLNNLIRDPVTTQCIIPVCLEELNKEIVPSSLRGRTIYFLSFSKLDPNVDLESILNTLEFESLRSLVYKLRGAVEISRPPLSKVHSGHNRVSGYEKWNIIFWFPIAKGRNYQIICLTIHVHLTKPD